MAAEMSSDPARYGPLRFHMLADHTQEMGVEQAGFREGYRKGFVDAQRLRAKTDEKQSADETKAESERDADAKPPKSPLRRILPFAIGGILILGAAIGGVLYWLSARHYETTDDAFIDAHTATISSQVAGRVSRILFDDNQTVADGEVLVQIDPRDFQVKVDQAQASLRNAAAQLGQAQAQLALQRANVEQAQAQVRLNEATLQQSQQDFARYRNVDPRAVTRQQVDSSSVQVRTAQARLDASRNAVGGANAQVEAADAQVQAAVAQLGEARVNADNAALQLSYTKILAPVAGRIAQRNVEVGSYVSPGQALFAVVPNDMWVTANFKESQLTDMRQGDPVAVTIDAYPKLTLHAKIDSFQRGTGSAFSTLPAENATGNYVKVVQRLPVKIVFEDSRIADLRLAPGLSVEPSVRVR